MAAAASPASKKNRTAKKRSRDIVEPQVNPANGVCRISEAIPGPSAPDERRVVASRYAGKHFGEMSTSGSFRRVAKRQHVPAAGDANGQHDAFCGGKGDSPIFADTKIGTVPKKLASPDRVS
jgi:hypothetical protein